MNIKKLTTLEEFEQLKVGDTILVQWRETRKTMKKLMVYEIPRVCHNFDEIICNIKQNTYFNYKMHLGLDTLGVCTSNARGVWLIESEDSK